MRGLTERELHKLLKQNGWKIISGAKHNMAVKDGTSTKIPIPRHKGDIPAGTVNSILKDAGLK
ncbi:MAG TPA: type II toxin-antitoxin system HicA family toxin [Oscillospiraceae bacterium]|nr:type II toxin-antitoxin system HicA family toxin [Oscillospiraceae bacterium]